MRFTNSSTMSTLEPSTLLPRIFPAPPSWAMVRTGSPELRLTPRIFSPRRSNPSGFLKRARGTR